MSEAESRELKVDINVIGPASHWCIRDEPQICAGSQSVAGELVFLHKAAGDSEVARFRSEAKRRYPSCRFQVVPRSSSELQAIHTQLQRENRYWAKVGDELGLEHLGVMTEGWTGAGLHPIEGYVGVPGVPAAFVDPLNRLFEARYGLGRVVAITYGGPV